MNKEKLTQSEDSDFQPFKKTEIKISEEKPSSVERRIAALELENKNQKDTIKKLHEELENDYLTGIHNKRHFTEKGEKIISIISNPELKEKRKGDIILREVARVFKENTRETDTVCRWGGEEIAMIFFAGLAEAFKRVEELRKIVQKETEITVSIGVAEYEKGLNFEKVLDRSDKALYLAKEEGRNRVRTYSQVEKKEKQSG